MGVLVPTAATKLLAWKMLRSSTCKGVEERLIDVGGGLPMR
jgi:hypothetical protein